MLEAGGKPAEPELLSQESRSEICLRIGSFHGIRIIPYLQMHHAFWNEDSDQLCMVR